jgi:hypothetical protein
MAKKRHPKPALRAAGLNLAIDVPDGGSVKVQVDERSTLRSAMIDQLPPLFTVHCGFERIAIPDGSGSPYSHGDPAWHSLCSLRVDDDGRELFLNGITAEILSADTTGLATGLTEAQAWGDKYGKAAALILGERLPVLEGGGWTTAACPLPGLQVPPGGWDAAIPALPIDLPRGFEGYLWKSHWCPGSLDNTPFPYKATLSKQFGASGYPLARGQRLDLALVVAASTLDNSAAEKSLFGICSVQLHFMSTRRSSNRLRE